MNAAQLNDMLERMRDQGDWLERVLDDVRDARPTRLQHATLRTRSVLAVLRSGGAR